MVDQPPEVNVTKQALQETLSGTQYDHRGIVNGLHLVLGNGLDQLHTSAICISLVCLSFTRDNTIQPANEETRDPKELLPRGSNIFPPEIAILLKAIDEDDKNTTKDYAFDVFNNPNVTRESHQLRFVTRREFNDHIKQFKFHDKWLNVCSKIENVVGISNKKICEDTMLRYLRSFLSVVTWLNKTDKLCPSRDFTVNINNSEVCGTYYKNFFYEQVQVRKEITDEEETDEEETDAQFIDRKKTDFNLEFGVAIKTAHLYLGDKKLRQLIGTEKSITAALNLGCARNYGNTTCEVVKESSVLVVGLVDYLSDFCMERVKAMQSIVDESDCHKVFTIGSRPIEDSCWLDTNKFPDQLKNNLFHEWDSPIMFPSLARKFDNNTHFDRLYVDHFVDDDMSSFRGSSMRDFYEQMLPELCSANLITDTSKAYIPFTSETIYALHASWSTVCKYATIKFVDKCAWSRFTNTEDSIGLLREIENKPDRKKVKKDVGEKLTAITKNITTGLSARKAACEAKESSKNKGLDCKDDLADINDESSQSGDDSDNGRRRATSVATKSRKRSEPKMVRCCSGDQCAMPDTPLNSFHKCKECKKIMHGTLCSSVDNEDGNMWCMNCDPGKPAAATNAAAPKATAPKATRKAAKTKPKSKTRTSSRKLACVSKESSKNKSIDTTDDDESCESDDDSDNGNNSSNVEDEDRESLPPKSVNVNETTVSSVTKEPQVVHQKYDYNRQPSYYGSVVVDDRTDQRIREDLRKYLRKYWYQGKKFIINDEQSRDLIVFDLVLLLFVNLMNPASSVITLLFRFLSPLSGGSPSPGFFFTMVDLVCL